MGEGGRARETHGRRVGLDRMGGPKNGSDVLRPAHAFQGQDMGLDVGELLLATRDERIQQFAIEIHGSP